MALSIEFATAGILRHIVAQARGRRPTVLLAPDLNAEQRKAAKTFDWERWMPGILSSIPPSASQASTAPAA